jgi:NAD-dependent deacetylase
MFFFSPLYLKILKAGRFMKSLDSLADEVAELIINSKRTVVFTGAGISTESGIPDFRSPGGIWERFSPDDFTYQKFIKDAEARRRQWRLFHQLNLTAEPNLAHYAIAELYQLGKLDCVITQNIDNLHQRAGMPDNRVFELHGNMQWLVCLGCHRRYPVEQVVDRLEKGEEVPDCEVCHGILKPDAVFFGEPLPQKVFREAVTRSRRCDLLIVIGSTLVVYPAAYIPEYALDGGAKLVIINLSSTPLDRQAQVLVRAKAGEVMSRVAQQVKEKLG